ncbi:MAG TPA: ABC transporter permease [Solirubrobacteraceae bacterium]|jgi:ABC-2 type transport system permease protein|nr:ABC transporter permease [Solirubrobacteraceae bacterium]
MSSLLYTRFELLRTLRNRRFLLLSLVIPLVLYFTIASPRADQRLPGTHISYALYFMVSLAAFGTMSGMLSTGARIAGERAVGWNRQLRISPLRPSAYFQTKVLTAYMMALISMAALFISGAALGVQLSAVHWLELVGLMLIGLVPFAALGITLGHMLTPDSIGPAMGGGVSLLALVGGIWFPLGNSGFLYHLALYMPSYWLVQASHVALGGAPWPARGWIVIAAWTVILTRVAQRAYRRDTGRV